MLEFNTTHKQQNINKWMEVRNIFYVFASIVLFVAIFGTIIILHLPVYSYFIAGAIFILYMIKFITYINK